MAKTKSCASLLRRKGASVAADWSNAQRSRL